MAAITSTHPTRPVQPEPGRIYKFFHSGRGDSPFRRLWINALLILARFIAIYPVLRVLSVSLRPGNQLLSTSLNIIPDNATLDNYIKLFTEKAFLVGVWNSIIITAVVATIGVVLGAAASAYAFSRWKFRMRAGAMVFLLTTQMIPAAMLLIPIYLCGAPATDQHLYWSGAGLYCLIDSLQYLDPQRLLRHDPDRSGGSRHDRRRLAVGNLHTHLAAVDARAGDRVPVQLHAVLAGIPGGVSRRYPGNDVDLDAGHQCDAGTVPD